MRFTFYKALRYCLIFILPLLFFACRSKHDKTGVWKADELPTDKAKELRQLNINLFKAIKTDRDDAELLFSTDYLAQKNIRVQFDYVNKLRSEDGYTLLKDFYVVNEGTKDEDLRKIDHPELQYVPIAKEMYIAFFIPKHKRNKLMLTVAYGKFDYGWRAQHIALGYYTQQGKTTTELYEMAKADYADGYLVNAINNITLALNCVSPSRYWKQANSKDIRDFADKLMLEANSKISYPIVLSDITSKPAIFSISSTSKEEGVKQYVYYLTTLNLKDKEALERENTQVKNQLPKIFPGIDKGKKIILYSAMREKPKAGYSVDHFDVEEKIDN